MEKETLEYGDLQNVSLSLERCVEITDNTSSNRFPFLFSRIKPLGNVSGGLH